MTITLWLVKAFNVFIIRLGCNDFGLTSRMFEHLQPTALPYAWLQKSLMKILSFNFFQNFIYQTDFATFEKILAIPPLFLLFFFSNINGTQNFGKLIFMGHIWSWIHHGAKRFRIFNSIKLFFLTISFPILLNKSVTHFTLHFHPWKRSTKMTSYVAGSLIFAKTFYYFTDYFLWFR